MWTETKVEKRDGANDPVHTALRAAVCVTTWRYLWVPEDGFEFVPALSDTIYGDGRALMRLSTIHSRPQFYVIRIDSRWESDLDHPGADDIDAPNFAVFVDDVLSDLEQQFGSARMRWGRSEACRCEDCPLADDEHGDCECTAWPALDDMDGCSWSRMQWPNLDGIETVPHPYAASSNLLAE